MKQKTMYMVVGVPGSGKTWVCNQLKDKYFYMPHDTFNEQDGLVRAIADYSRTFDKAVITECPFAERDLREKLRGHGLDVKPFFIIEPEHVVAERYYQRTKKEIPKSFRTRANTIMSRAIEWEAPFGPSEFILNLLRLE